MKDNEVIDKEIIKPNNLSEDEEEILNRLNIQNNINKMKKKKRIYHKKLMN